MRKSRWQAMMKLRAGRRAFYLGFAALCGIGSALPAAAQSYLADNGSNVTVDYSVLGQGAGPGPVNRAPLPYPGGAMPAGTCSCANAPLGVIAAAPRPTFTNPFAAQITQAPAVPPGFMAYSAAVGSSSGSGGAVVLREPNAPTQMAASAAEPVEQAPAAPLPSSTPTQNGAAAEAAPTEPAPDLPPTTPTQSEPSASAAEPTAPTGGETPPTQPEDMPTNVPSPVEQPPVAETPPVEQAPAEQAPPAPTETQTAEAPPETPPAGSAATSTQESTPPTDQQAAVTPATPPAEGTTPPAESGGALPAGGTRILYTGESDDVPAASTGELDTIAQDLLANQDKRIQVMAFAAGTEEMESKARRKSLARGLAIRSYLIKAGVPSTRIDVRALGNKAEGGPADRVDIIPAS
jgi:outer membrane protein OmpA-like peptidoglycan-associated protein